ncbi:hypothetical protein RvY_15954 [Ramazzottius varieornatus]|uniref:Uncharacterized protein n=1 Tax=Ramazzottius varieornatus TaxID=947166 RepID=A0A1D1W3D8_RAMVA|nr:hypothetical protein RvY_15954 [Ramazzottius varieornatus]
MRFIGVDYYMCLCEEYPAVSIDQVCFVFMRKFGTVRYFAY